MLAAAVFGMKNEQHMHGRQLEPSARCGARDPRARAPLPPWLLPPLQWGPPT